MQRIESVETWKTPGVQLLADWLVRTLSWIPPVLARNCGKERIWQLGWLVFIGRNLMTSSEHPRAHVSSETLDVIRVIYVSLVFSEGSILFSEGKHQWLEFTFLFFDSVLLKNNCLKNPLQRAFFYKSAQLALPRNEMRLSFLLFANAFIYLFFDEDNFILQNTKLQDYRS